jgi:O-acetyl-ADP-ribose deacetylase (regulator of RNase III)
MSEWLLALGVPVALGVAALLALRGRRAVVRERSRVGQFVVTSARNLDPTGIICAQCGRRLAEANAATNGFEPPAEELHAGGAVAVPNFGWFCGQACGNAYETEFGVRFQRNNVGEISYY